MLCISKGTGIKKKSFTYCKGAHGLWAPLDQILTKREPVTETGRTYRLSEKEMTAARCTTEKITIPVIVSFSGLQFI